MNETIREAKILIVDDNSDNLAVAEQMLRKGGYAIIHTTNDSRQAVSLVASITPDLLILDLHMPPPDGFAILDELRISPTRDKLLPILVLTGDIVPATKVKALAMGAKEFLTKPVDRVDLLMRTRNLLEWRFAQIEAQAERARRTAGEGRPGALDVERDILNRLAAVYAAVDSERAQSGERVAELAFQIGRQMDLDEVTLNRLRCAAKLFDIGMLALPESVRQSTGKLTAAERQEMKRHTTAAEQIFGGSQYAGVEMAREIAAAHHERWDGGGYPLGLEGANIPLAARIVAIAQVYDALITEKPYRPAWPAEDAAAEVERQSEFAFDPNIVSAFLDCREALPAAELAYR